MRILINAFIAGVAAAVIGDMWHSVAAGFAALVVMVVVFVAVFAGQSRLRRHQPSSP